MAYRYDELKFGSVRGIDGNIITVRVEELKLEYQEREYFVEVGCFVNCGDHHGDTICVINKIHIEEVERKDGPVEIKIAELNILGGLDEKDIFVRGIDTLPTLNSNVYLIAGEDVNNILGVNEEYMDQDGIKKHKNFKVGVRPIKGAGEVYLNLDKFLGRHVAIIGTTGSGKSCTVASIVQSILRNYPYPRLLFFDIHNEYTNAFKGEWEQLSRSIKWNEFSLPYWFLDLEEFIGIYHGGNAGANQEAKLKEWITELKRKSVQDIHENKLLIERVSVDSPIYFDIEELIGKIDEEIDKSKSTDKNTYTKMKLKIQDINSDSRYEFLKKDKALEKELSTYFIELLGLMEENKYLNILDLSGIPSEVRTVCIGVLARLCFDYCYWDIDPENLPLGLVLEEAHNYIPDEDGSEFSLCKKRIEKIAKEGRKYGLSLIVVSQRPSNVSTTVLSQCGTFIALRLTNDLDQNKIKKLLPDVLGNQANILPSLKDGEALVSGDAIKLPGKVYFNKPNPEPKSNDVRYHHSWTVGVPTNYSVKNIIEDWKLRERSI